ncbi:MAG TPA: FAD:protein FMN transferase [Epsilonproteobacteria bacterium]|nr:FAD:protein FMN transferase [Campylobacterota bacterium]
MLTRTQALMGTFVYISLEAQQNKQISQSFRRIKEIELSLSSYDREALVYKLNYNHHVPYDTYLAEAIDKSKQYYQDTQGYFDITIGSISKDLYHFGEEHSSIPSKEALKDAKLDIDAIEINATTISTEENITIDLGGMGKGYAVDKVAIFLQEQNISKGTIALSGDIRCLDVCAFELQSPFSEQTFASLKSKIPQLSISTSGTYRRYVKDASHNHLINPKTAKQGKAFVSVSLFTYANNAKIDAYATAISVMPRQKALEFLEAHDEIGFVLVEHNGKIVYGNLEKFVSFQWLDYKEKATMIKSSTKSKTKSPIERSLIHPDTTNPVMISR